MDIRKIRKLIELLDDTNMAEIEVTSGEETVRIKRYPEQGQPASTVTYAPAPIAPQQPAGLSAPAETAPAEEKSTTPSGHKLLSPMVGTVYLASAPGEGPFVSIGQQVNAGDTLCLIEAMKMFNKIEADKSGILSARLIENEQPVEFNQPLFIIDTGE